ncbi:hypothetical protein NZD89_09410 [Alicyclobacillus fastidiosus]|uniref:Uncharacterized protein n=1 Tax=Alicyclobacillus fastidiosus TaxID=392011 RepID=A0ABY6ZN96_9BACL|nr:hypothetical protein [Alicyclobacillus fastidiosus]WAH43574.1 hypothetical protein NZD89_09410 [Alicyclobacillus fastidiosus]GMA59752.1 hypothetical protein GCM10025859_01920 [Alicyclobacillus fastidiosus]
MEKQTTVADLIQLSDLMKLSKDILKSMCDEMNLDDSGSADYLAERLWSAMISDEAVKGQVVEWCIDEVFAGKTSVVWFRSTTDGIQNVRKLIVENHQFDPFATVYMPQPSDIGHEPYLFGAIEDFNGTGKVFLRFIHKTGTVKNVVGSSVNRYPRTSITNVFVDEKSGYLEVRAAPEAANLVAKKIASMLHQQISIEVASVVAPFGYNVESLADALKGELVDTVSKPEELLEDFTSEHAESVVNILEALDGYFKDEDIGDLEQALNQAKLKLGEENAATQFTVLILNGLSKVSLRAQSELRGKVLYDYLRPNLQHQGGYVRFSVNENGLLQKYTIRVGIFSNSIYFMGSASEQAIAFVRNTILGLTI